MRKLLIFSLLAVLAAGTQAAINPDAKPFTLKKTGILHVRPSKYISVESVFVSPGCQAYSLVDDDYSTRTEITPSTSDVKMVYNTRNRWYEVPVKAALPNDTHNFCVYVKGPREVCAEYDDYMEECLKKDTIIAITDISNNGYYDYNFFGGEELFIASGNLYTDYNEIKKTSIYLFTPENWSSFYVHSSFNNALVNSKENSWTMLDSTTLFPPSIINLYDTLGYKDTTRLGYLYAYDIDDDCSYATNKQEGRQCYNSRYPIIDTIGIDSSEWLYYSRYIQYLVNIQRTEMQLKQINETKDTVLEDLFGYDIYYGYYDGTILDTVSSELAFNYNWYGEDELYHVHVEKSIPTYDTSYSEVVHEEWFNKYQLDEPDYYVNGKVLDTLSIDSSDFFSEQYHSLMYKVRYEDRIPIIDLAASDTLYSSYNVLYEYDTTSIKTFLTVNSYYKYQLDRYSEDLDIIDTIAIDSSYYYSYDEEEYIEYTVRTRIYEPELSVRNVFTENRITFEKYPISGRSLIINAENYNYSTYDSRSNPITLRGQDSIIYVLEDPDHPGKTMVTTEKPVFHTLFVMLPNKTTWFSENPVIRFDNETTESPLTVDQERCGWYKFTFINTDIDRGARIYSSANPNLSVGLIEDDIASFNLSELFGDSDTLFINTNDGTIYKTDPKIKGVCAYTFAGIIYDTDVTLNPWFSEYQGLNTSFTRACVGVHQGIVDSILGEDGKPKLSDNLNAKKCFGGNAEAFNTLFNHTPGVNEGSCYDFNLHRLSDSRWGYTSDDAITDGIPGGFYPVENKTDLDVFTDPLPAARTKRAAEGPVTYQELPDGISSLDKVCNGPGWQGGIDCEGRFESGDEIGGVVWDWMTSPTGGERWTSEKRNQHFCFESHATFTYHKGQNFTAIGDDDIWVFIAGKIAIDNGGAHLATPGYVDLDIITDKNGNPLIDGQSYDFDLFFCDRRTTMSNMTFKTNIYLTQKGREDLLNPCVVPEHQNIFDDPEQPDENSSSSQEPAVDKDSSSSTVPVISESSSSSKPADSSSSEEPVVDEGSSSSTESSASSSSDDSDSSSSEEPAVDEDSSSSTVPVISESSSSSKPADSSSSSNPVVAESSSSSSNKTETSSSSTTVKYIVLPEGKEKDGYVFAGWYDKDENFLGMPGDSIVFNGGITLKAHYNPIEKNDDVAEGFENQNILNFHIQVQRHSLLVSNARIGKTFAILDMQGRVLKSGTVNSKNFSVDLPLAGSYLVKIEKHAKLVVIR